MQVLPPALLPLAKYRQFICWFAWPSPRNPAKLDKIPCTWWDGAKTDAHASAAWTDAATALAYAPNWDRGYGAGVGFVLTAADPFFFIDVDGAYDRAAGAWSPIANDFVRRFAGAAVEVSMSGVGLHIIGCCHKPFDHAKKNTPQRLEFYTEKRFIALTGQGAQGDAAYNCNAAVAEITAAYFQPTPTGDFGLWTYEPLPKYSGPADDTELINRALASGSRSALKAFGGTPDLTFADLWTGNVDALARKFPPNRPGAGYDASSADMALANMLAFWTGKNCERMRGLMEQSALRRDKWHTHRTYLADTVIKACGFTQQIYTSRSDRALTSGAPAPTLLAPAGPPTGEPGRILGPVAQAQLFDGCYFDKQSNRVYNVLTDDAYKRDVFDTVYGGRWFLLDDFGQAKTKSAWEAFVFHKAGINRVVDGLRFRPERATGEVTEEGGKLYLNTYCPFVPVLREGDPAPFLEHLRRMLPEPDDFGRVLSYFAACVQYPGVKFQWWPVIQGIEGNGKSLLGNALRYAVGSRFTHYVNSAAIAREGIKFNAWIDRKLLVVVEEIMLAKKRDFLDEFKPYVTNDTLPFERKGQDQTTVDNRANGILFTNHKDGVPVSLKDRRYGIFYTAQQEPEDLVTSGMSAPGYWANLWAWAKGEGAYAHLGTDYGFSVMAQFLRTMPINAEYNPNPAFGPSRAPKTNSTAEALLQSLGPAEQEVLEAAGEGRPGFAGGWVSGKYLAALLENRGFRISPNKRADFMKALGFVRHPALDDGRPNNPVMPDNARSVLYLRAGHLALNLSEPRAVAAAYEKAQAASGVRSPAQMAFEP